MSPSPRSRLLPVCALALAALAALVGCGGKKEAPAPPTRFSFAVFSDPHIHDVAALGASGPDYEADLAKDRKMWKESAEILDSVIADLKARPVDVVLVPGDLTKDGEKVNHQLMARKLGELRAAGKKVFVVPGNHDVNNPDGRDYRTVPATRAAMTSPADFRQIYNDCGYGSAIATDPASLSYVAEPVPGVWLLAMDSCRWSENTTEPITAGALGAATRSWVKDRLAEAKAKGKTVMGMMHHGVVEHFAGQAATFPEYLVADRDTVGRMFVEGGMNVVFTGHYHANDVAAKDFGIGTLTDVETGSLVTAPSPYRTLDLDLSKGTLAYASRTVTATANHATDFPAFSTTFLRTGLTGITRQMLMQGYQVDAGTADALTPLLVEAMMAHYGGDENLAAQSDALRAATQGAIAQLHQNPSPAAKALGDILGSLWTDLSPKDNAGVIALK